MNLKYPGDDTRWPLAFGEHFNTSTSDSELRTIAQRYGFQAFEEQLTNASNNARWTNADVFFTNKTIHTELTEKRNTDYHNEHGHTFCYLCSIDENKPQRTKPRDESKKNRLVPYNNPKARLLSSSSDQSKKSLSSTSIDFIPYRFIVRTGTQKHSGTRAQVFLYLYGTEHNWTSVHLQKQTNPNSSKSIDGFPSGSVRTFCLKGPNIGQLHHLNVNLVGCRSDKEWFLKEIEITNLNSGTTWLCEFDCWLPRQDEQQSNETKLTATIQQHFKPSLPPLSSSSSSMYILQVLTGEKAHAADNNATVQIKIRGSIHRSCQLMIKNNRANLFHRNQLDTFVIIGPDLGDLLEMTVESDKNQAEINWHIKDIIIRKIIPNDEYKQSQIYFPFNICLNKRVNRFTAKKEIYPSTDYQFKGPIYYHITVKTGNVTNAGTDSNIFMVMYGKSGRTAIHQINNRSKSDFERNTSSEFNIMDIDVGIIDRIRIWHDNSNIGAAWFLESVIIRKKYSTSHVVSSIYTQRIEHISKVLYRQFSDPMKKTPILVRQHSKTNDDHISIDRQRLKSKDSDSIGSNERLNGSRSILRSPTVYDKANLRKKVTWDEQSIGSQDDVSSIDSRRLKTMHSIDELEFSERNSFSHDLNHSDHEIHWISSHSYIDHKWKIKSIEETNSFDFDSKLHTLLLSDRSMIDSNNMKTRINENDDDEIYEFAANCWLKKDKPNDKLEIYLTPKSISKSALFSDGNIDFKINQRSVSNIHHHHHHHQQQHDNTEPSKFSSPRSLKKIEKLSKSLNSHNFASQPSHTLKTKLNHSQSMPDNIHPLSRSNSMLKKQDESPRVHSAIDKQLKSSRHLNNDFANSLTSEEELLSRITTTTTTVPERSHHIRPIDKSLSSLSQHSKYPLERIGPIINNQSRLSTEHVKSPHNLLTKFSDDLPSYSRSTASSMPTLNRNLKSSYDNNEFLNSETTEGELLKRITHQSSSHSRPLTTSLSPLTPRVKLASNNDNLSNPFINRRDTSLKMPIEPSVYARSTMPSLLSSSPLSKSPIPLNNDFNSSLPRASTESNLKSKSSKRSNPNISLEKPMNNPIYNSAAYGTSPLDDF